MSVCHDDLRPKALAHPHVVCTETRVEMIDVPLRTKRNTDKFQHKFKRHQFVEVARIRIESYQVERSIQLPELFVPFVACTQQTQLDVQVARHVETNGTTLPSLFEVQKNHEPHVVFQTFAGVKGIHTHDHGPSKKHSDASLLRTP